MDGILLREAFALRSAHGSAIEQIDGVISLDGQVYIVEMKWVDEKVEPT